MNEKRLVRVYTITEADNYNYYKKGNGAILQSTDSVEIQA